MAYDTLHHQTALLFPFVFGIAFRFAFMASGFPTERDQTLASRQRRGVFDQRGVIWKSVVNSPLTSSSAAYANADLCASGFSSCKRYLKRQSRLCG